MEHVVLDASVGIEMLGHTFTGNRLAKELDMPGTAMWTVDHFGIEVTQVLRREVLNRQFDDVEASRRFATLTRWDDVIFVRTLSLLAEAWQLRHNVTIHDALYVVLARRLGGTLVTGDRKLAKAPGLGVPVRMLP